MFLIDDILLFPAKSIIWVFKEIHNAAKAELENEADNITLRLSELYMLLETKQITEEEFDEQEKVLLDRLDGLQADPDSEDNDDEDDDDEEQITPNVRTN